jgi:succinate dehydrogenase / fumarate reductase iron-sulfur subunit
MAKRTFRIWRGDSSGGEFKTYEIEVSEGMVVLDVLHDLQAQQVPDLAVRWNCKAGKCGSCSCEINGKPKLSCMTRMNSFEPDETITVQPLRTFPVVKDLVTDVSWNYAQNKRVPP